MGFTPSWQNYDRFFDESGNERLLSSIVSSDSAGADLFPTLAAAQDAVRSLTGNATYRLTMGRMQTALDADRRTFPFEFSLGLAPRLTLSATIPIVVTRVNATINLDSTSGNAGWNQASSQAANPGGAAQVAALLGQLQTSAAALMARIAAGDYGCPGSAACANAQAVLARAQSVRASLATLSAASTPAAPVAGSAAGTSLAAAITSLSQQLAALGVPALSATMALPSRRFAAADVQTILSEPAFGFGVEPFRYRKISAFGDLEAGLRIGLIESEAARLVVHGGVRFPTGRRDSPDNFIDLAPADRQLDVSGGVEAVFTPGSVVSLHLAGGYTRQFADRLERRVASVRSPITTAAPIGVNRDLGDIVWAAAYPGLRLSPSFTVYASGQYFRKGTDRYSAGGTDVSLLEQFSRVTTTSFGGGIHYRSVGRDSTALPVEAGMAYTAAFRGSGGFAPKSTVLTMYLRFFYRLWGSPATAPVPDPTP